MSQQTPAMTFRQVKPKVEFYRDSMAMANGAASFKLVF